MLVSWADALGVGNDGPCKPRAGATGVSDGIDVASSDVFLVENMEQKVGVGIRHGMDPVAPNGALSRVYRFHGLTPLHPVAPDGAWRRLTPYPRVRDVRSAHGASP